MNPQEQNISQVKDRATEDPLDFIAAEHLRQRKVCATLDKLAELKKPDPAMAVGVLPHFDRLLAQHVHDEEDGLFPLLRGRSDPGDDINDTLDRLIHSHRASLELAVRVKAIVRSMALEDNLPDADEAAALTGFADHERRNLIVENAIVLPLARARLTAADMQALRARLVHQSPDPD